MQNKSDEQRVAEFLNKYGFVCKQYPSKQKRAGKTPDFQVYKDDSLLSFCEVKSVQYDTWEDGGRKDPTFNRLTNDIHTAVKQLDAVNPNQETLNVLAIVNHDFKCSFQDLLAVLTGNFYSTNNEVYSIYRQFSDGRIKSEKERIHLFIWLDDYKSSGILFKKSNKKFRLILENWIAESLDTETVKKLVKSTTKENWIVYRFNSFSGKQ